MGPHGGGQNRYIWYYNKVEWILCPVVVLSCWRSFLPLEGDHGWKYTYFNFLKLGILKPYWLMNRKPTLWTSDAPRPSYSVFFWVVVFFLHFWNCKIFDAVIVYIFQLGYSQRYVTRNLIIKLPCQKRLSRVFEIAPFFVVGCTIGIYEYSDTRLFGVHYLLLTLRTVMCILTVKAWQLILKKMSISPAVLLFYWLLLSIFL